MPTPPPSPRPRGPKAVKVDPRSLVSAAERVFARDGLQAASLRAIAKEAGCDPALIYYHFRNKEGLLAAIMETHLPPLVEDLRGLVDPADSRSTAEKLWGVLQALHHHCHLSQGFRAMVRGEIVQGAPGIQAVVLEHVTPAQRALRELFQQGMARGELRADLNPVFLALFLVRMEFELLDLVPQVSVPLMGVPGDQALSMAERAWFDLFWRGIAAQPGGPLPFDPSPELP